MYSDYIFCCSTFPPEQSGVMLCILNSASDDCCQTFGTGRYPPSAVTTPQACYSVVFSSLHLYIVSLLREIKFPRKLF